MSNNSSSPYTLFVIYAGLGLLTTLYIYQQLIELQSR